MALSNLEIDLVVRWRDLQRTGAELRIDRFVGNDRNFLTRKWTPRVIGQETQRSVGSLG